MFELEQPIYLLLINVQTLIIRQLSIILKTEEIRYHHWYRISSAKGIKSATRSQPFNLIVLFNHRHHHRLLQLGLPRQSYLRELVAAEWRGCFALIGWST